MNRLRLEQRFGTDVRILGTVQPGFDRPDDMATYLVTGGAGFIGSHLAEELARRGHSVRIADSLITGRRSNVEQIPQADFRHGDLADLEFARSAVSGCEYVLHQAAIPSVPRSVADPVTSHRANVDGTLNVLVAARESGVKRVVFAGSSSVYGNTPTLPKHEAMPVNPMSPYALQKAFGEQYLQLFTTIYGLATVTTRYFNVFGPRQDPSSAVLRRHFAVRGCASREPFADDLRRRRADARFHLCGERGRRRHARVRHGGGKR